MKYSIYTITCKDPTILDSYVGRTSLNPILRFRNHKTLSMSSNRNLYKTLNLYGGIENWNFTVIEEGDTLDIKLPKERERYYCDTLKPTLNKYIPNRDYKEWRHMNRNYYNAYMNKYLKQKYLFKKELKYYHLLD